MANTEPTPKNQEQSLELQNVKFSKTALNMGLLEQKDLEQALQRQKDNKTSLRQILLESGLLTNGQAASIEESMKSTKVLYCSFCQKRYVVVGYSKAKSSKCQECKVDLELAPEERGVPAEATEQSKAKVEVMAQKKAPEEIVLSGAAKDLDIHLPEESQDEMCGQRVHDYKILSRLGAGAMGVVYKAEQVKLQRVIALKMLLPQFSQDEFYNKRFMAECRAAAQLNHPNILQIYDADSFKGRLFFAMEFVQGESIMDIIDRMNKLPVPNAIDIITQITQALCELHEHKLVHRDIKPGNIMLTTRGIAKLADLGLAKNMDYDKEMESRESGVLMGSPYYIAPEQISNSLDVDCRADIFSLGATFYRIVTAVVPFFHPDPRVVLLRVKTQNLPLASTLNKEITDAESWIIDKMMQKKPEDRFQTPAELLDVLQGLKEQNSAKPAALPDAMNMPELAPKPVITPPKQSVNLDFVEEDKTVAPAPGSTPPAADMELLFASEKQEEKPQPAPPARSQRESGRLTRAEVAAKRERAAKEEREQSEGESKPPRKQFVPAEETAEPTSNRKLMGILFLAIIVVVIFAISSGKKKPTPPVKPVPNAEAELAARIAQEYATLSEEIEAALKQGKIEVMEVVLPKAQNFREKYPSASDARRVKDYIRSLEEKCLLIKSRHRCEALKGKIESLLAQNKFAEAEQELSNEAEFPHAEMQEEVKNLHQQINDMALAACQKSIQDTVAMLEKGQYHAAITLLQQGQNGQSKQHVETLSQKIAELQQEAKKYKFLLEARETIYTLVVPKKFLDFKKSVDPNIVAKKAAEARQLLEKYEKDNPDWAADIVKILEQLTLLENIDKALFSVLKNDLKNKDFRFCFSKDDKEDFFEGKVITVSNRRSLTITSKKGVTKNWPLDTLTWNCRKELLTPVLGKKNESEHQLAMLLLIEGDLVKIDKERTQWNDELQRNLADELSYAVCLRIKRMAREQKSADIDWCIDKFREACMQNKTGQALWDTLAEILCETGNALADKAKAAAWYKLVLDHFPNSSCYQMVQQKLTQSKQ